MSSMIQPGARAAAPFIKLDAAGIPHLSFQKCSHCNAMFLDAERMACGRCGARDGFTPHESAYQGTLHSFSIVHRGFPGIAVPFISAVVDLDDGPAVKGNLRGLPFDPAAISLGMRVKVVFDDALGRKDAEGNSYISHFFEPA
jgi:uncharacterized OB-fold protein